MVGSTNVVGSTDGRMMQVRKAKNDDGLAIGDIANRQGFGFENWTLDWDDIEPYWLVVEDENKKIVGAIQFSPGKPLSWLEFMVLEPEVETKTKIEISNLLVGAGAVLAQMQGSQGMSTTTLHKSFDKTMERQGWTKLGEGTVSIRRV